MRKRQRRKLCSEHIWCLRSRCSTVTMYQTYQSFLACSVWIYLVTFLPPANEVWGKVIFLHLSVILFTGGGVPGHVPPRVVHPLGRYIPLYTPRQCMLGYGQQAGGAHPTGMHSCHSAKYAFGVIFSQCEWKLGGTFPYPTQCKIISKA